MKKTLTLLFLITFAFSFSQQYEWTKTFGSSLYDIGYDIATDANSNIYSVGYFNGSGNIGDTNISSTSGIIIKHDENGNVIWTKLFYGNCKISSIRIDVNNNLLLTGRFIGSVDFNPSMTENFNLSSTNGFMHDAFILKLDNNGNFIWATKFGSVGDDFGTSIAYDSNNNVYVGGIYSYTVDFDPTPNVTQFISNGPSDGFIVKLSPEGNFIWAKNLTGVSEQWIENINIDNDDNLFFTGNASNDTDLDPSDSEFIAHIPSLSSHFNLFYGKLDSNGNFLWGKNIGDIHNTRVYSSSLDTNGNLFITGEFNGTVDFNPSLEIVNLNNPSGIFLLKLSNDGNFIWVKGYGSDSGYSVCNDTENNVYLSGMFHGTAYFNENDSSVLLNSVGNYNNAFLLKLNQDGGFNWVKQFVNNTNNSFNLNSKVDLNGNVYTIGIFENTGDFNPNNGHDYFTSNGGNDIFISKISNIPLSNTIFDEMDNEIVLYPNPSNGIINLESKSEFDLNIVNVLGQKISSLSLNSYNNFKSTVSLNIESGIYYLIDKNLTIEKKIVIKK